MKAAIVVPYRGGDTVREANWDFCRPWWERFGYPIYQVEHPGPEPFNRAFCINEGARRARDWDVLVVIDADTLEDRDEQVTQLVIRCWETGRFAVGHVAGKDLNERGTSLLLRGQSFDWNRHLAGQRRVCDSRVNAIRRDLFEELGGYDTRFHGWGHEDVAFTAAVKATRGDFVRIPGNSWHLWHEPMLPKARVTSDWKAGKELANRYLEAPDGAAVQRILAERTAAERFGKARRPPKRRRNVDVELVVITNGRRDYLQTTLASAAERLHDRIAARTIIDDSADPEFGRWLDERFGDEAEIVHHERNLGFSGMMRAARAHVDSHDGPPYVFWLEEDFTFDRDVELDQLATLLDKPGLVQAALLRGPYYPREIKAGSIPNEHPESYTDESFNGIRHLSHRRFWTSNPHLAKRESFAIEWPAGRHTESRFGRTLWDRGYHVAFLGDGSPWITHIGADRGAGHGY